MVSLKKLKILDNSGWTFLYLDGKLIGKEMFAKSGWVVKILNQHGLIKDLKKFQWLFEDPYHSPATSFIDEYLTPDVFTEEVDVKAFIFTDDDYEFTPYEAFRKVDPKAKEDFETVAEYLVTKYKYKEREAATIKDFIS
jgi:hypothetical protein